MLWLGTGGVILLFLLLGTRLFVTVKINFTPEQHVLYGRVTALRVPIYKKTIELDETIKHDPRTQADDTDNLIKSLMRSRHLASAFLSRLSIRKFQWQTVLGMKEADIAGIAVGGIWSIKTMLLGSLSHLIHFQNDPHIDVFPQYQRDYFSTQLECIFSMTIGQILYCSFLLLRSR